MMVPLGPADFDVFFRDVHGRPPFPWQRRLAARVVDGDWPSAIALPTGCGKTSVIDIAVFALACQADRLPEERTARRRMFFVVDRRIVVDEAYDHAVRLADALMERRTSVLRAVAERLKHVAGESTDADAAPLACAQLRGGVYRDDVWARTPLQPTVITSTVDQVGSRLLYRGYGVTDGSRPIQAGLVALDSLLVLDEAHCSNPFLQTLEAVRRYSMHPWVEEPIGVPLTVVSMTATPSNATENTFALGDEDLADQTLRKRLEAPKPARLVVAAGAKSVRGREALVRALCEEAERTAAELDRPAVGIVVNRVATARAVYDSLRARGHSDVDLLIGRMRAVDRDGLSRRLRARFATAARQQAGGDLPLSFVVATQCIEVGADLDFDVMVSECASIDALRQRFGRLNRSGRPVRAQGVVVVREDQTEPESDPIRRDPVYGDALAATWKWLREIGGDGAVDMGVAALGGALQQLSAARRVALTVRAPDAPVLMPAHLDVWAQTSPVPAPDPDVAPFLHGVQPVDADVNVCWRADLDELLSVTHWMDILSLVPPVASECLPVPIGQFRRWLESAKRTDDSTDVEGARDEDDGQQGPRSEGGALRARALLWRGSRGTTKFVADSNDIRPGDVLVLAASSGGWDELGWVPHPWDTAERIDRADEASVRARARAALRLQGRIIAAWPWVPARDELIAFIDRYSSASAADVPFDGHSLDRERLDSLLGEFADQLAVQADPDWKWLWQTARELSRGPRHVRPPVSHPSGGIVLVGRRRVPGLSRVDGIQTGALDEDDRSASGGPVRLDVHTRDVALLVSQFADALTPALRPDFEMAARFHDAGKADVRFQAVLRACTILEALVAPELLAKSGRVPARLSERVRIRDRAGYPAGARHELTSTRLLESAPDLRGSVDPDLVLHLVASHHGWCRPFAPVVRGEGNTDVSFTIDGVTLTVPAATGLERCDSGVAERFWRLVRRYGWWGLAYLEAVFRLADQVASRSYDDELARDEEPLEVLV